MVVDITKTPGYEVCGDNNTLWAIAAGDPNYNLLNPCCQAMNSRNPGNLGYCLLYTSPSPRDRG